ncbi:activator of 90 kDa heat shock protein ATPase homolog 1 isoform X2 [Oratosquilla oratoria]|uniref:activator of 90 kDa heat shock protein ATPase homolog 1 isoform X2 n=1 Tax=Oratosquilla oratoria TaxID=337810 RepID=UPI003F776169
MAKWGEGDPRWIVEERPDATNVNNWHWSEKNASAWSKEKLKSLLEGKKIVEPGLCEVEIKELTKCDGEAIVNNRKGKLIFFYEWVLKIDWKGHLFQSDKEIKGHIEVPNLSEENEPDEVDINVTVSSNESEGEIIKEFLLHKGKEDMTAVFAAYIDSLKKEYASDLILPTKDQNVVKPAPKTNVSTSTSHIMHSTNTSNMEKLELGCKIPTSKLTLTQTFKCTADEFYQAFTQKEMVVAFTRNDVKMEVEKGGKFELFGGNICGQFEELAPGKKIVQKWRFKTWPSGHYSRVVLDINQLEDAVEVKLTQTSVPSNDLDRTREGWKNYYWESMKRTFGFGVTLM